jgi:hypothetical protein
MHPRPHGRVEKIFALYIETGTLTSPPTNWQTISRTSTTTSPKRSSKPAA